jgi:flagellar biosynthetic protein FliO
MDSIQPFLAVALVLGLLCGALYVLRARGAAAFHFSRRLSNNSGSVELLERVALGPNHAIHLVRVGERSLVVATAPNSCQLLCQLAAGHSEE